MEMEMICSILPQGLLLAWHTNKYPPVTFGFPRNKCFRPVKLLSFQAVRACTFMP